MKAFLVSISVALLPGMALAQAPQQPPRFVPFAVTEADAQQMRKWLDEQPMKFSLPVLQWMDSLEQRELARIAKEEADKKAAEEHNQKLRDDEQKHQQNKSE